MSRPIAVSRCVTALVVLVTVAQNVAAQSSITDTDIAPKGRMWSSVDFMRVSPSAHDAGWSWYTATNAIGITDRIEIGTGVSWLPGDNVQPIAATPGFKWRVVDQESSPASFAVGANVSIGLGEAVPPHTPTWGMAFGIAERTFGAKGPTAGFGAYSIVGTRDAGETRAGLIVALSQSLHEKMEANVEWISGDNWFGYLSPGVSIYLGNTELWLGYSRGTRPQGNSGFSTSFGVEL